jgi:hypothetical protein
MAKLPNIKKISREDVKDAPSWIDRIINPLNTFMEQVYYALNKNITFSENIACNIKDLEFKSLSTYTTAIPTSSGFSKISFTHGLSKVSGVLVLQLSEKGNNYTILTSASTIDWSESNGTIHINYITGLSDSKTYSLRVLVL